MADASPAGSPVESEHMQATSKDYYFDPKARHEQHQQLIKCPVRQETLSHFIAQNRHNIEGKTVLVVGSGLGLLAMQCARSGGAKKVVGIDESSITHRATEVAVDNGLGDVCTYVKAKLGEEGAEERIPLERGEADVILCEWMGNLLSNEPIAKQMILARDLYLKKDGTIVPDTASLYITGCADEQYKADTLHYWDNVYGFRMHPMKKLVLECPVVSAVSPDQITTHHGLVHTLDAYTMTAEDCDIDQVCIPRVSTRLSTHTPAGRRFLFKFAPAATTSTTSLPSSRLG